ncbi:SpoIIE family protein phosphatase [Streptomyces sp. NPDC056002]|uniref:SpoIIE family protein phosphatase n=1 Tax=Streptomyces sp. NPDC056002 TaxID=3345675 RepID=UPI0035DF1F17
MFDEPDQLFDVAHIALAVLDGQGAVTGWTSAAEHLVGYSPAEIVNQPSMTLLDSLEDRARAASVAEQCRVQGGWDGVVAVRHRDGRPLRLRLHIFPLLNTAGGGRWAVLAQEMQRTPGSELSRMMLEPLLVHSPVGVAVLDTDLRYLWVNDMLTYGGAVPREQRLGRRPTEVAPHEHVKRLEGALLQVLETGTPVLNWEMFGPAPADPPRQHAWWTCIFRLEDSVGQVLGVWYMNMDNTDRWRAREGLALLTEASARIGSTLDVVRTAQELAEVAVPRFTDVVVVDLLEPVLHGEEPASGPVAGLVLRRAGQQSIHDGCPEVTERANDVLHRSSDSVSARCMSDGLPILESLADVSSSAWVTEDPARAAMVRAFRIHSALVVPVRARGVRLGVATFLRSQRPDPFDQDDVSLAEELVARAAVCLDNARRYTRERRAALTLQHSLLPRGLTTDTVLEIASRYLPADAPQAVGGDWFDVIPLSGARVALVVGDVVGHGTHAAATMGRLRAAVHTLANLDLPPDELLAHLDDLVVSLIEQEGADDTAEAKGQAMASSVLGATCLYAVYDPVTRRCTMARAGHLPPAIVGVDGTVTFPDLPAGPPLGLGFLPFESAELELPDDTLLALFTDGLIDDRDRDVDAGLAQLADALAVPAPALENVCENVTEALLTGLPSDDAALLLARTHGLDASQVASWDLSCDPAVVADARHLTVRKLAEWGLEELQFTSELVISELVTNAIRYGAEPIRLRLIRRDVLICEVADGSSTSPRMRHARTTDEGGRGLFLIAQLARRWGTRYTASGKIIWVEQDLPAPDTSPSIAPQAA